MSATVHPVSPYKAAPSQGRAFGIASTERKLARLEHAIAKVALLHAKDPVYLPILVRLAREITVLRAMQSGDLIAMANAAADLQRAMD